jgi:methylated-DNA-[protein]-cysteine S-methyltransferase
VSKIDSTKEPPAEVWSQLETTLGHIFILTCKKEVTHIIFGERELNLTPNIKEIECPKNISNALNAFSRGLPFQNGPILAPKGTEFQQLVWSEIRDIPIGKTMTYGAIAKKIGRPQSTRAVGQACGANPIPFLIPCHRVVSARGAGGFSLGLKLKIKLFEIESIVV